MRVGRRQGRTGPDDGLLATRYPGYGWERNQGYATQEHRDAIRQLGLTPFHRRSFLALQRTLAGDQISLDLFDEAVASLDVDPEVHELDRLDGPQWIDREGVVEAPDPDAAAVIAAAEAIVREGAESKPSLEGADAIG